MNPTPHLTRLEQRVTHAPTRPHGVLWDMDGTLIDTEPYWMEAENDLIESHGGTWSDAQAFQLVGNALIVSGRIMKEQTGIPLTPEEIVDALLERVVVKLREHVPWRPGARELLLAARDAGLPCALVTMSYESFARVLVDSLPAGTFEVVVTGDMVEHGKPHPEPYLRAAHNLALAPEQCVAIEDSATGVRSAVAAGVPTVAVPHLVEIPSLPGLVTVRTLAGVDVDALGHLWQRALPATA